MKKLLFVLLSFIMIFSLAACGDDKPVVPDPNPEGDSGKENEGDKGLTAKNLQAALKAIEKEYKDSKGASVAVSLVNGEETMNIVLTYKIGSDNLYSALQYELRGETEIAIYIQEGYVYSSANGSKSKEVLETSVNDTIKNDYGLDALLEPITKFYGEAGLYDCLTKESENNGVYVFALDLANYSKLSGTKSFATAGKDSIKIIVTTVSEKITTVKVEVKEGEKTSSTEIKYQGLNAEPVFPSDLDTYK